MLNFKISAIFNSDEQHWKKIHLQRNETMTPLMCLDHLLVTVGYVVQNFFFAFKGQNHCILTLKMLTVHQLLFLHSSIILITPPFWIPGIQLQNHAYTS